MIIVWVYVTTDSRVDFHFINDIIWTHHLRNRKDDYFCQLKRSESQPFCLLRVLVSAESLYDSRVE